MKKNNKERNNVSWRGRMKNEWKSSQPIKLEGDRCVSKVFVVLRKHELTARLGEKRQKRKHLYTHQLHYHHRCRLPPHTSEVFVGGSRRRFSHSWPLELIAQHTSDNTPESIITLLFFIAHGTVRTIIIPPCLVYFIRQYTYAQLVMQLFTTW